MKMDVREKIRTEGTAAGDEDIGGYAYALALVQFAALALGLMTVTILSKVEGGENGLSEIAIALASVGLWVFLVPLGWYLVAMTVMGIFPRKVAQKIIGWTGGMLIFCIIAILVLSMF